MSDMNPLKLGTKLGDWLSARGKRKADLKKAKIKAQADLQRRRDELALRVEQGDQEAEAELLAMERILTVAMGQSWKDEYVTLVFTFPWILMAIGSIVDPIIEAKQRAWHWAVENTINGTWEPYSIFAAGERMVEVTNRMFLVDGKPIEMYGMPITYGTIVLLIIGTALGYKVWSRK